MYSYDIGSGGIRKLDFRTQPIIPLTYSDSLSYMEQVSKLTAKTNEIIDKVNSLQDEILEQSKQYTDNAIKEAVKAVDEAVEDVNNIKRQLQTDYNEFTRLTNAQLLLFNTKLDDINKRIDDTIVAINKRTDLAIQQNNEYILDNLSKYLSQMRVINYFTGASVTIQEMFDYLALLHVENALTYNELISKNINYNSLAGLNVTYTDLVLHGTTIIQ